MKVRKCIDGYVKYIYFTEKEELFIVKKYVGANLLIRYHSVRPRYSEVTNRVFNKADKIENTILYNSKISEVFYEGDDIVVAYYVVKGATLSNKELQNICKVILGYYTAPNSYIKVRGEEGSLTGVAGLTYDEFITATKRKADFLLKKIKTKAEEADLSEYNPSAVPNFTSLMIKHIKREILKVISSQNGSVRVVVPGVYSNVIPGMAAVFLHGKELYKARIKNVEITYKKGKAISTAFILDSIHSYVTLLILSNCKTEVLKKGPQIPPFELPISQVDEGFDWRDYTNIDFDEYETSRELAKDITFNMEDSFLVKGPDGFKPATYGESAWKPTALFKKVEADPKFNEKINAINSFLLDNSKTPEYNATNLVILIQKLMDMAPFYKNWWDNGLKEIKYTGGDNV